MKTCRPIRFTCIMIAVLLLLAGGAGCTGTPPASPAVPVPGSTQDYGSSGNQTGPGPLVSPGSGCDPQGAGSWIPVPVDTSVPIQDPMPGIRYSLNRSETGRTLVLGTGDIVEINLGFAPSLAMRWVVPVSGCGLELVNDGTYYTGGDFWNTTGYYRARYRAVSPGTSVINGKLVFRPEEAGGLLFNLTVIVK
jgi:hypothetical protein